MHPDANPAPDARTPSALRAFLDKEVAGGALLIGASLSALVLVNAVPGGANLYHHLLHAQAGPILAPAIGPMTAHLWINDGLIAIFFLLVGLEIKREWMGGQLASRDQRMLPFIAAAAGMVVPALLYLGIAGDMAGLRPGWAIPAATDIAFALGVLALLGSRVPASLKLLLTTIAIVDDMGAIAIIALAYTASLNGAALLTAGGIVALMVGMNRRGVRHIVPYCIGFAFLWYAMLLSGVHATLAGVLAALTVPAGPGPGETVPDSTLNRIEHALLPWVAFLILPIFGFANAGVVLPTDMTAALLSPLPLAIAAGLFAGKQIGIFAAIRLAVAAGIAPRPHGATWVQLHAMALLCGIGFTMSLFIGGLAFPAHPALVEQAKIGVLAGSLLSALSGFLLFRFAPPAAGEGAAS